MNKKLLNILLWLFFIALSVSGTIFSIKYFSKAMPLISLDVTMDRKAALESAKKLAQRKNVGPKNFHQAAKFTTDQQIKIFVELENGGKDAFVGMMENKYFMPYTWDVRHFKENEKNEAFFRFTPDGKPYGFEETLSEDATGTNILPKEAQKIAEKEAQNSWNINFDVYTLIETSKRENPSKRIDHMFIYERNDVNLNNGFYRLKIIVSGNKVTTVIPFVKIPENFIKKYQEMRSYNNTIATAGSLAMILLYIIGGCIFGLLYLNKKRYILWKKAAFWAAVLGTLKLFSSLNNYPLIWTSYNTALPTRNFLFSFLMQSFINGFAFFFGCFLLFMAAESLTRKAFKNHPQLWKLWSQKNANSLPVIGRTLGGYLMVPIFMSIVVATYFFATKLLGWWSPSDSLIEPNILATYAPWLGPVTLAFGAGFIEECLFRAVPLSCAALLGDRFGKKKLWIFVAFIIQILIFGAAHANYATQPAYARVLELIVPSTLFGLLYLFFGLLPAIISHFVFDVVLMSLPIFISSTSGSLFNKTMVILLSGIPLLVIVYNLIRKKGWSPLSQDAYNSSWMAPKEIIKKEEKPIVQTIKSIKPFTKNILILSGCAGILAWGLLTQFKPDAPAISTTKKQAISIAKKELTSQNIILSNQWTIQPQIIGNYATTNMQHKFIWQLNKKMYKTLLNSYLDGPYWQIKFVRFNGTVDERTEQYTIFINNNGKPFRFAHKNSEIAYGKNLNEEQARKIVIDAITTQFSLSKKDISEISATKDKKPNRTDWTFIYSKTSPDELKNHNGQLRIYTYINGDKIVDINQYIHVPEQWKRNDINKQNTIKIIINLCSILFMGLCLISLFLNVFTTISIKYLIQIFIVYIIFYSISIINNWQTILNMLNTSEPFNQQLFRILSTQILNVFIKSSFFAYIITMINRYKIPSKLPKNISTIIFGLLSGFFIAGANSFIDFFKPSLQPLWGNYSSLDSYNPLINSLTSSFFVYIFFSIKILLLFILINKLSLSLYNKKFLITPLLMVATFATTAPFMTNIGFWIIYSTLLSFAVILLYNYYIIYDFSTIPLSVAGYFILFRLQNIIFNVYPYAQAHDLLSIFFILTVAIIWFKSLNNK